MNIIRKIKNKNKLINITNINHFNLSLLIKFMDKRGNIISRKYFNIKKKIYHKIVKNIKISRNLYLLPFLIY